MVESYEDKARERENLPNLMRTLTTSPDVEGHEQWIRDRDGTTVYYYNSGDGLNITGIWQGDTPIHATPENGDMVHLTESQLNRFKTQNPELYAALDAVDARVQLIGADQQARTHALE